MARTDALGLTPAQHDAVAGLLADTGAPVTARLPWLGSWARTHPDARPLPVLDTAPDGTLRGAALLAVRPGRLRDEVVAAGHLLSDEARLPVRTPQDAPLLAAAVVRALAAHPRPWRLRLDQLPAADPVAACLVGGPLRARLVPGGGCPVVVFRPGRRIADHASENLRKNVRKGWNRLRKGGADVQVTAVRGLDVVPHLDEIARVHVRRDHDAGRGSDIDDPSGAAFWHDVLRVHAERDELRLWHLRIDGRLAAYDLGLVDGPVVRVWDGRFDPDFASVNAGRLVAHAMLEDLLADPAVAALDWMRGEEQYKLQTADTVVPYEALRAWSGPASRTADLPVEVVGRTLRRAKRRWPELEKVRRDLGRRRFRTPDGS